MPFLAPLINKVLNAVIPDPVAKAEAELKVAQMIQNGELAVLAAETDLAKGQLVINQEEAKHENIFVSGWRPFIGWVCGLGLGFQFLVWPILSAFNIEIGTLDMGDLVTILLGILGLGGLRTYEKFKGVAGR